jgi:hypothetical protein
MGGHPRYAKPEISDVRYVPLLSMDEQHEAIWVTNCMCPKNYRAPVFLLLFAVVLGAATSKAAVEKKRRFASRDSVEMSYFGTLIHSDPSELDDDGIVSPNGRYVVKITHRGVLPEGVTEGTIWLFDAAAVKKSVNTESARVPIPIPLARMSAAANGLYAHFNGALPYGDGLKTWLDRAAALSSEKIRAPVLYTAADPWHLIAFWELYASLREQVKPVELQYFRSGQHSIRKPLQRWAHQEMLVDWFDFWLNDHEDPDTSKAEQYGRWHKLREMQSASENSVPR